MTKHLRFVLLSVMILGAPLLNRALGFSGADDFSGGDAKWAYFYRRDDSVAGNGLLTFNGSTLEFTKAAAAGSYLIGWDSDPASTASRATASFTSNWVVDVAATNTAVTTTTAQFATTGIQVAAASGSYTAIMLGSSGGTRWVRVESNSITSGSNIAIGSNSNVRLRISWNAAAKNLTTSYSVDGGGSYAVAATIPLSRWPTQPTAGFYFEAFGNSNLPAAIPAGQVALDNFALTAATIAGSDNFSGGSAKWATTYRVPEAGSNGLLKFNGSAVEFTKSTGIGGHHYMWDGDGIAGNGTYTTPISYTTSWVMEATVRNAVVAEAGKWASIGIEVATAPGSYTDMLLENYSGELLIVGETNSPTNIEDVPAPAGTDVRLRVIWDAQLRTLTGTYSFNGGASYTTLASIPISVWPVSPATTGFTFSITGHVTANAAVTAGQMWLDNFSITTAPVVTTQPASQTPTLGAPITLNAGAGGTATYQWQQNGANVTDATGSSLTLNNVQPANTGVYRAVATDGNVSTTTDLAIVGVVTGEKVAGTGGEVGTDILHANGNTFDQILLQGPAATIRADSDRNQITRMSFIDGNGDIVQVELGGPGNLSLTLAGATNPAPPVNYVQAVDYVSGHASIVVTGANETTNLSVFTVGRGTAVNQTLFRNDVTYHGLADVGYIAISSTDGKFGGLRAANVNFWNTRGITGVYAPGVEFLGPVYVGDIDAFDDATPMLVIGAGSNTRITGGDLQQTNGRSVQVAGLTQLQFTGGATSHYVAESGSNAGLIPAQQNRAVLEENGLIVTSELVTSP